VLNSYTRSLGEDHPETLKAMAGLALIYLSQGFKFHESISLLEKSCEKMGKLLGEEHPQTLWGFSLMAQGYRLAGKLDESMALLERVVEAMKRVLSENHSTRVYSIKMLESWQKDNMYLDTR
jgi:hypothetical protein